MSTFDQLVLRRRSVLAAAAALAAAGTRAQSPWPVKPVKIILPYPAGGGADPVARLIGQALGARIGQPVVVDFRPGANGAIGATAVAHAAADGYTLLFVPAPPVVHNKLLYRNLPYDPERDFTPITKIGESPMLIVVNPKVPARTLPELVAYAKANPGKLKVAHVGVGSMAHLTDLLIERQAGIKLTLVPYATAQRMNDLLSGEIDMIVDLPAAYLPHIATGKLRAIAVMTKSRFPTMPDVPTAAESGFPGLLAEGWYGLYGPKELPRDIVARINQAVGDYLRTPEGAAQMLQHALAVTPTTPEAHVDFLKQEYEKWGPIIRDAKISLE